MLRKGLPLFFLCLFLTFGAYTMRAQSDPIRPEPLPTIVPTGFPEPPIKIDPPNPLPPSPEALLPAYVPEERIPVCPNSDPVRITAELAALPADGKLDYAAAPRCRSQILDLPVVNTNYQPRVIESADSVKAAAQFQYSFLGTQMTCAGCNGSSVPYPTSLYMIASAQGPTLLAGNYGWGSYFVSARMHAISDTNVNNCNYDGYTTYSGTANVSLGHTKGFSTKGTFTGDMQMFWEDLAGPFTCSFNIINHTVAPNASLYYNIYTQYVGSTPHYIGRFWWNGGWEQAFDKTINFGDFVKIDVALEVNATHEDFGRVRVPLNFVQKVRVAWNGSLYPLHRGILPAALQNVVSISDAEWNWMDALVTDDFTSVTGTMNY